MGYGGGRRKEADLLGFGQVMRGVLGRRVRGSENENPMAGGSEGKPRTPAPTREDRCHFSYVHLSPLSPSTHVVQGRSPSHLWWDEVSPRDLDSTSNVRSLTAFFRLAAERKGCSRQYYTLPSKDYSRRLTDRKHMPDPCAG